MDPIYYGMLGGLAAQAVLIPRIQGVYNHESKWEWWAWGAVGGGWGGWLAGEMGYSSNTLVLIGLSLGCTLLFDKLITNF
jgi:hypothetical protein